MTYLGSQRRLVPSAQVTDLTSGSFVLPSAPVPNLNEKFEAIASQRLTSNASQVVFSSIPSTYKNLQIRMIVRSARSGNSTDGMYVTFNSSTSGYYDQIYEAVDSAGTGASMSNGSYAYVGYYITAATANTNEFTGLIMDIFNYSYESTNTSWLVTRGHSGTTGRVGFHTGFWNDQTTVSNIRIASTTSSNLLAGSTFSLYGLKV